VPIAVLKVDPAITNNILPKDLSMQIGGIKLLFCCITRASRTRVIILCNRIETRERDQVILVRLESDQSHTSSLLSLFV